jgi:hypothetical protein
MAHLKSEYYMLRSKNEPKETPWYKAASGTSNATPKLYLSEAMAYAAVGGRNSAWEAVKVTLQIEENP